jgi:hypothetical protein
MVPAHPPSSLFNLPRTNLHFPLSVIPANRQRLGLVGVEHLLVVEGNGVAQTQEVDEDSSKGLVDEGASKAITTMITEEVVVVLVEDEDLDGKITTNHSETAMRLLISSLTGRCWRRSILTAWPN